jgi:hypothetical protein
MAKFWEKVKGFFGKIGDFFKMIGNFFKNLYIKCVEFFKEKTKNVNWKVVWDKFTTGLLIFLIFSPLLILAYIFLWFLFR